MPMFLDTHPLGPYKKADLMTSLEDEADEFGVLVHQMLFNEEEDVLYCICGAPNVEAIKKHHKKFNTECKSIIPIDQIQTEIMFKEEKFKTIGLLSGKISHDIRNPLSVIKGSVDLLKSNNPEIALKEKTRFDDIDDSIKRINHQISDILSFLRTRKLEISTNSVLEIVDSVIRDLKPPQNIVIEKPENHIQIDCDLISIKSVFTNILLNAIQAIKDGGKISIKTVEESDSISINFENTGPTIPEKLFSKIFEPLFTTKMEGTGLGLPSCKKIIEDHGGMISVQNNPVTFKITLPKSKTQDKIEISN